jgi:hypothetical protein
MRRRVKEGGESAEKELRNEQVKRLQRNMVWKMFFYAFFIFWLFWSGYVHLEPIQKVNNGML